MRPGRSKVLLLTGTLLSACSHGNTASRGDATVTDGAPRVDVAPGPRPASVGVLTQHNDIGRSGANLAETCLTPAVVPSLHPIADFHVAGLLFAQPLVLPAPLNLVIAATTGNVLAAFDTTKLGSTPVWQLGTETFGIPGNVSPGPGPVGILSTPVIDPATNRLYLIARHCASATDTTHCPQTLHVVDATSGKDLEHVDVAGQFQDDDGGVHPFLPDGQMNRPALLLVNGRVFAAWGVMTALPGELHEGDVDYHGTVMAFDASNLQAPPVVYVATPNGFGAGIWQAGAGLTSDGQYVYAATGNSTLGPGVKATTLSQFPTKPRDQENSVVRLLFGDGGVQVSSYFDDRPYHDAGNVFQYTNYFDFDLSSSGVALIPESHALVVGSKGGIVYLLDRTTMKPLQEPLSPFDEIPLPPDETLHIAGDSDGPEILGAPVVWRRTDSNDDALVYACPRSQRLTSFQYLPGKSTLTVLQTSTDVMGPSGAGLAISANGSRAGSAVLWATTPQGRGTGGSPSQLLAYDPLTLQRLWQANIPGYPKFNTATVAAGRVYVPSWTPGNGGSDVLVFGTKACGD